jgi:hypothetical protein
MQIRLLLIQVVLLAAWCMPGAAEAAEFIDGAAAAAFGPYAPPLVTRDKWQARPALPGMAPQTPTGIIIHHTGERQNLRLPIETKLRNLQSFSQRVAPLASGRSKPAWPDVPYHFYVDAIGRIAEGRNVRFAGDTNTGYDTRGYIQVVVEGDFEKEQPAPEQMSALRDLLAWLMLSWNIGNERISVHKDHAPTDCPGRHFLAMLPAFRGAMLNRRNQVVADLCMRASGSAAAQRYCRAP